MTHPDPTPPHVSSPGEYLTVDQAAARLNVSPRFVRHLIQTDQLPVHRFGRSVRIKRTTLDETADAAADRPLRSTRAGTRRSPR